MKKTILLIEDDVDACLLFKQVLSESGYHVKHHFNGSDFFRSNDPAADLYIIDICLPGIDGIALTKYLRTREELRHATILIISSNHAIAKRAQQAGADAFAPKPFQLSEFLKLVQELAERELNTVSVGNKQP